MHKTALFIFAFLAITSPALAQDQGNQTGTPITDAMKSITKALESDEAIFVPEGSEIVCTIDEGCVESDGGFDYHARQRLKAQPTLLAIARSMMTERANEAVEVIQQLTPADLLTKKLARAVVRDMDWPSIRGVTWAAREHVFDKYQCGVFSHYDDPKGACWTARAFERSAAEHAGIPNEIMPAIRKMRSELYALGRLHMKSSENLRSIFEQVKPAMIYEFNQLFYGKQTQFVELLDAGLIALDEYSKQEVRDALETFLGAERQWRNNRDDENRKPYEAMQAAEEALQELVDDVAFVLFWNRRHSEGGPALLEAYGDIITDLRDTVRPFQNQDDTGLASKPGSDGDG